MVGHVPVTSWAIAIAQQAPIKHDDTNCLHHIQHDAFIPELSVSTGCVGGMQEPTILTGQVMLYGTGLMLHDSWLSCNIRYVMWHNTDTVQRSIIKHTNPSALHLLPKVLQL